MNLRPSVWTLIPGGLFALGVWLGELAWRNMGFGHLPLAEQILAPLWKVEDYVWPSRWTFYTPYSSVTGGGLPAWASDLWLLLVAYLLGAAAGKAAQRLFQRLRNQG